MDFRNVMNSALLSDIKKLTTDERKITTEILHHLKEIEARKLHLQMGYSNIYDFTIKELGYSEGSAYRRVSAMRLLKSVPEVDSKIKEGSLTLDGAAKIQRLINHQKKEMSFSQTILPAMDTVKFVTREQKLNLVESLQNKSLKEMDKAIFKINPSVLKSENVRQISEEKIELKLIIDEELKKELDHLKNLLSHKNPNMSYQDLIKYLAQLGLKKFDPSKKLTSEQMQTIKDHVEKVESEFERSRRALPSLRSKIASSESRYIPSAVKQEVYMRDKGCCTFEDPRTKHKCESRHLLQYDHRYPFSLGGETTVSNLRLLCYQHHKYITENSREAGL